MDTRYRREIDDDGNNVGQVFDCTFIQVLVGS